MDAADLPGVNFMNEKDRVTEIREFTGMNRILKSRFIQYLLNRSGEGTFEEFVDDWRWIFSYSKKYRGIILFYLILGILSSTLSLGSAVITKYMIDIIVNRKLDQLWMLIFLMVFSTGFSLLFSSLVNRFSTKISIFVHNDIQADIFDKIMDADWMRMNDYSSGDLLNRFNADVTTVAGNAVSWLPNVIISLYTFAATFVVICYYDVTMAFLALLSAPVLLLCSRYLMGKMREHKKKLLELNSSMMSFEVEAFYNYDTVKSFGVMDLYSRKLKGWQEKFRNYNLEYNMFSIKTNAGMSLLGSAIAMLSFGYCLFRLWTGGITYGTMTLFLQQRSKLSDHFNSMVNVIPGMLNSALSAHRVRELVELPRERHDQSAFDEVKQRAEQGFTVEFDGVDFAYVKEQKVLRSSSFVARPNEIVAIVGPSGEGKTTMLRLMLPDEGCVTLTDCDGSKVEMNADLRGLFSYVPQGNTLFSGTIAENLRMVKEDATVEEMEEALKIACAWEFVQKLDGGIDGKLGERGRGVSEGQAQRIAIARAVLRNAPILLLDEATSALDVETERAVLRNIVKQRPNKTCIVSTHRPSVLSMCQRVYRVVEQNVTVLDENEAAKMVKDF